MVTIFKNIDECVTLSEAARKEGRYIQEQDLSIIKNASIVTKAGKIVWVGDSKKIPKEFKKSKEISLKGLTVLPGFIDCHTHLVHAGNRGHEFEMKFQGRRYQEIAEAGGGIINTVQATRNISEKDLLIQSQKKVNDFLKQGVTTIEIKSGYGLNFKTEEKILKTAGKLKGAKIVKTFLGPHAKSPDFENLDAYMDNIIKNQLPKIKKLASRADIFIENGYFTVDQAKKYFVKAQELGLDIVVHTNQMTESDGIELGIRLGAVSCDHINYLSSRHIELLAKSKTTGVFIPSADFYLKTQYPPARELLDLGARCALSTDFNPGSSPTMDIQFVGLLARKEMKMKLHEVICAWTVSASHALNIQNDRGSLDVGKSADFIAMGCSWRDLFYQVGFNRVADVYIDSKKMKLP